MPRPRAVFGQCALDGGGAQVLSGRPSLKLRAPRLVYERPPPDLHTPIRDPSDTRSAMRVILINPAYQADIEGIAQTTLAPPMGLLYLAGAAERAGHHVQIVDANAYRWSVPEAVQRCAWRSADAIGITATTPTIDRAIKTAQLLREAGFAGLLLLGGPHVTALPEQTLRACEHFDAAALGEAEDTFIELLAAADTTESTGDDGRLSARLCEVAGLLVRTPDGLVRTAMRIARPDVDSLAPPARHLLPGEPYDSPDGQRFAVVVASRGCPAPCSYCNVPGMFGRQIRRRDPGAIADEVAALADSGVRFVDFIDDTFTWSSRWVQDLCAALHARKLPGRVAWLCLTRVDRVTPELLQTMADAGCKRIEMGVECASTDGLDALHKGIDEDQVRSAFASARAAGMETLAFAMVNVPGEGLADIALTERLLDSVDPDYLQLTICTPYPGTSLYDDAVRDGTLRSEDFADFRFLREVVLDNGVLDPDQVMKAHRGVQRRFWLRPRRVLRMVKRMVREPGGPRATLRMAGKALDHLL